MCQLILLRINNCCLWTYVDSVAAIVNLSYDQKYGYRRCNFMTDVQMEAGVYCYVDDLSAIGGIGLKNNDDKRRVIGVIAGWLLRAEPAKGRILLISPFVQVSRFLSAVRH